MTLHRIALATIGLLTLAQPAAALTFNFTTKSGDTLTGAQSAAFQTAANVWSSYLTDAVTVNLQIGFSATLGANVLGATSPTIVYAAESGVAKLLAADAKDGIDRQAVASLSTDTQQFIALTSAEARAIGAATLVTSDGTIEFSSTYSFSNTRNADGGIAAGTYDLIGIAEHEIGHLLGFVSSIDGGTGGYQTLLDQFRYGASGVRSVAAGASAYFSYNGGATSLAAFSTGIVNGSGDQASHWLQGVDGVMVPEASAGSVQNITAIDIQAFDAIGYDVAVAVPEPWSLALLALGTLAAATMRPKRRA